jgi:phage gp29-like protein
MIIWPRSKSKQKQPVAASAPAATLSREVAAIASDMHEPLAQFGGLRPNRDPLLAAQAPAAPYAYPYGLFEEALDKDAHLSAILAQRKAAVLGWEREVLALDGSEASAELAAFASAALDSIGGSPGGFERDLAELLDGVAWGFAVSEVLWERRGNSLLPVRLLARHPRRFVFDSAGELRLLTAASPTEGEPLPPHKFIVFAPYGRHENPYGLPLLRSVWWLAWFKRQALKFWLAHAERFGSPTAVLKYPLSATEREKQSFRRVIATIQQECGLVLPQGVELSLLEAGHSGSVQAYSALIELCNAEMSKAVLGQTLTTEPGARGARSLGEVHMEVRQDIVRQDAQALMSTVNETLLRWIVELNFGSQARLPIAWTLTPPAQQDLALQLEIDRFFADQGLPQESSALYARYDRKAEG